MIVHLLTRRQGLQFHHSSCMNLWSNHALVICDFCTPRDQLLGSVAQRLQQLHRGFVGDLNDMFWVLTRFGDTSWALSGAATISASRADPPGYERGYIWGDLPRIQRVSRGSSEMRWILLLICIWTAIVQIIRLLLEIFVKLPIVEVNHLPTSLFQLSQSAFRGIL